jgi:hypothetical protein
MDCDVHLENRARNISLQGGSNVNAGACRWRSTLPNPTGFVRKAEGVAKGRALPRHHMVHTTNALAQDRTPREKQEHHYIRVMNSNDVSGSQARDWRDLEGQLVNLYTCTPMQLSTLHSKPSLQTPALSERSATQLYGVLTS